MDLQEGTTTTMILNETGKAFAGMTYPDAHPICVPVRHVKQTTMSAIPAPLREHAQACLSAVSGDEWWTIGEFRYAGEDYTTAVARWKRTGIEYGIEI